MEDSRRRGSSDGWAATVTARRRRVAEAEVLQTASGSAGEGLWRGHNRCAALLGGAARDAAGVSGFGDKAGLWVASSNGASWLRRWLAERQGSSFRGTAASVAAEAESQWLSRGGVGLRRSGKPALQWVRVLAHRLR
ncbi:hypothetical protein EUGRSUZ_A01584 [Eucalyptus grandis]|uniref:Uncharacterized protein n=2 Tax=Eucalyptus grandis TaxID=71139 RepID=A0ACC3M3P0_EUCGR|nr:hypothetical protein EUGRSUZ_A01584 [Eucalyptus grandis]